MKVPGRPHRDVIRYSYDKMRTADHGLLDTVETEFSMQSTNRESQLCSTGKGLTT